MTHYVLLRVVNFNGVLRRVIVVRNVFRHCVEVVRHYLKVLRLVTKVCNVVNDRERVLILRAMVMQLRRQLVNAVCVAIRRLVKVNVLLLTRRPRSAIWRVNTSVEGVVDVLLARFSFRLSLFVEGRLCEVGLLHGLGRLSNRVRRLNDVVLLLRVRLFIALLVLLTCNVRMRIPSFLIILVNEVDRGFLRTHLHLERILTQLRLVLHRLGFLLLNGTHE